MAYTAIIFLLCILDSFIASSGQEQISEIESSNLKTVHVIVNVGTRYPIRALVSNQYRNLVLQNQSGAILERGRLNCRKAGKLLGQTYGRMFENETEYRTINFTLFKDCVMGFVAGQHENWNLSNQSGPSHDIQQTVSQDFQLIFEPKYRLWKPFYCKSLRELAVCLTTKILFENSNYTAPCCNLTNQSLDDGQMMHVDAARLESALQGLGYNVSNKGDQDKYLSLLAKKMVEAYEIINYPEIFNASVEESWLNTFKRLRQTLTLVMEGPFARSFRQITLGHIITDIRREIASEQKVMKIWIVPTPEPFIQLLSSHFGFDQRHVLNQDINMIVIEARQNSSDNSTVQAKLYDTEVRLLEQITLETINPIDYLFDHKDAFNNYCNYESC